jgi:hypothetical protein
VPKLSMLIDSALVVASGLFPLWRESRHVPGGQRAPDPVERRRGVDHGDHRRP